MKSFLLALGVMFSLSVNSISIKTIGPQREDDQSHQYFTELLSMALKASNTDFDLQLVTHQSQYRNIELLSKTDLIDIVWTGQSKQRDEQLLRIPFPLFLGGLGVRGAIIHNSFADEYAAISSIKDLKKYIVCQGLNWPDADILKAAGINVFGVSQFDSILKMVELKRCDLFPLSILEGAGELATVSTKHPELIFSTATLLHYQLNMYFYVKKSNQALANSVLSGLKVIEKNGRLADFMKVHPLTQSAFPINQFRHSKFINIDGTANALVEQMQRP